MGSISQINLVLSSPESPIKKTISVTSATCAITKKSISELAYQNLQDGYSHCLAFVSDIQGRKSFYDAAALIPHLAKNQRWKWLTPKTSTQIKKIYYLIIHPSSDPIDTAQEFTYQLVKKIKTDTFGSPQTYEDFWFGNNLASAVNKNSSFSFYSFSSLFRYYEKEFHLNPHPLNLLKYQCMQSIGKHYGKGVSILACYLLLQHPHSHLLECYLFSFINYQVFDEFLLNESLIEFIECKKEKIFEEKSHECLEYIDEALQKTIQSHSKNCDTSQCLKVWISSLTTNRIPLKELEKLTVCKTPNIRNFAKAILCIAKILHGHFLEGIDYNQYIHDLICYSPDWTAGKALQVLFHPPQSIDELDHLSQNSNDPLFLSLVAEFYHKFNIFGSSWGEPENVSFFTLMHARNNRPAFKTFASRIISKEPITCINLMERTFSHTIDYLLACEISEKAMIYGLKIRDLETYLKGINMGISIFRNRDNHHLVFPLVSHYALEEITPFPLDTSLTKEAITILNDVISRSSFDQSHFPNTILAAYQIRKGSLANAKKAYSVLKNLQEKYPLDLYIRNNMIRYQLRVAATDDDIESIEDQIEEFDTLIKRTSISDIENRRFLFLIALWLLHPLYRPTKYLNNLSLNHLNKAIDNLEKAFIGMQVTHVQILINNMKDFIENTEDGQLIDYTSIEPIVDDLLGRTFN